MTTETPRSGPSPESAVVVRVVTVIIGVVVGLTFMFGFGNVLNLALRLGVPVWVAPLVAPAVDLSVIGLLLGTRHLALAGAPAAQLRPARRLLIFASVVTLALNVADPLVTGEYGKAAFDAVGPLLLIGWAEVGPGFLQAIGESGAPEVTHGVLAAGPVNVRELAVLDAGETAVEQGEVDQVEFDRPRQSRSLDELLEQARREDTAHRKAHQKPISADTLRVALGIGATRARRLVKIVRSEHQAQHELDQCSDVIPV
ncbi:hypothetical protein [Actinophytocola sp. KF-1]